MSSYIVSPKHMKSIEISTIELFNSFYCGQHTTIYPYFTKNTVPELWVRNEGFDKKTAHLKIASMCVVMQQLNIRCFVLQYAHHYEDIEKEIETQIFCASVPAKGVKLAKIALYKAIECLFYQIELTHLTATRELTFDEKQAIEFFKNLKVEISENVVHNMNEYDNAQWGIN